MNIRAKHRDQTPASPKQILLPEVSVRETAGLQIVISRRKIPHQKILEALQNPELGVEGIAAIYRERVLPVRTRTLRLLGRKQPARIVRTLLGYEVQAARKRVHCPDMVTARYVRLFTAIGCRTIKLPYDPTVTAQLVPALERAEERIHSGVASLFPDDAQLQKYVIRRIFGALRAQLNPV
jgi:hypothetical protein